MYRQMLECLQRRVDPDNLIPLSEGIFSARDFDFLRRLGIEGESGAPHPA
jgi:hypothetical protein